ncbi:MAG: hypothetical protein GY870_09475 [archaeon]|nr:hypothetical protein [archaeon]
MKEIRINIPIDPKIKKKLKVEAEKLDIPLKKHVHNILSDFVSKSEK